MVSLLRWMQFGEMESHFFAAHACMQIAGFSLQVQVSQALPWAWRSRQRSYTIAEQCLRADPDTKLWNCIDRRKQLHFCLTFYPDKEFPADRMMCHVHDLQLHGLAPCRSWLGSEIASSYAQSMQRLQSLVG